MLPTLLPCLRKTLLAAVPILAAFALNAQPAAPAPSASAPDNAPAAQPTGGAAALLTSPALSPLAGNDRTLRLDGIFYQTGAEASTQVALPSSIQVRAAAGASAAEGSATMPDGRTVRVSVVPQGGNFVLRLSATPDADIKRWGFAIHATPDEYFTGLSERVVDGPQQDSSAPGLQTAMNLRGIRFEMLLKPTISVYAPYYLSSRGYATFALGTWPGFYDFCVSDPSRVWIQFEGPSFEMKIYTSAQPSELVKMHAMEVGPPILPPKWNYSVWRWRDEHTHRETYYDGTPVTGPFNSESMEDVLLMRAYGIPCGVYWIDRPWGLGFNGYDDFDIDEGRLPNFNAMVKWLKEQNTETMLWIGPFYQGDMAVQALERGWNLAEDRTLAMNTNNYPLVDFTNPAAVKYWQDGLAKLLKAGVAGYKLDRAEENMPTNHNLKAHDGRSLREVLNDYPVLYLKAAYDVAKQYRGDDFVLMPRAAYTGSSKYGTFWGGDIAGTPGGLRGSVIGLLRSAVLGYPNWGSDIGGYNMQTSERDMLQRWLGFGAFTPIMEVGPTRNRSFWDIPRGWGPDEQPTHYYLEGLEVSPVPRPPEYDAPVIATWRLYARLHTRLMDYSYAQGVLAHRTGMPIARPMFFADPQNRAAWDNWWTYQYGPDIVVSPIWEPGKNTQDVYLPAGNSWRYAWTGQVYEGGRTVTVNADVHQVPFFVRMGADLPIGDMNAEWNESVAIANTRPDLKALDAEMKSWLARQPAQ